MLIFSGCANVANSRFVHDQQTLPDFATFVAGFLDSECFRQVEKKDELPLFMPAEYANVGVRRCAANVLRVHFLVFDVDTGTWEDLEPALARVQRYGHIVYTSFSHSPNQLKIRILVKLDRPVEITEWSRFWIRAAHFFGLHNLVDRKCADACHMYYVPGARNRAHYQVHGTDGPGVSVDDVLKLELPVGEAEPVQQGYQDVLEEEDRGEINQGLKDVWEGKLQNLYDEICNRPYPGPIYDLKSHGVFGVARGIPHIISEQRVRAMVRGALEYRYKRHLDNPNVEGDRQRSYAHVDIAISEGMESPWWPPKIEDQEAFPLTDWGLAERLVAKHADDLAFEPNWKNWLVWNTRFWNLEGGEGLVKQRMKKTVRDIPDEADVYHAEHWTAKEELERIKADPDVDEVTKNKAEFKEEMLRKQIESILKFAQASEAKGKTMAAIELANSEPEVQVNHRQFNRDPWLLNFRNGTVDLRDGKLRPHNRSDYITRMVPHEFDAKATCPTFDRFLLDCMLGRKRLVDFIWRLLGYSAVGLTSEQILILNIGEGSNGKSTFINVIQEAFGTGEGGYGFAANSENLLTTKGASRHETWRMSLFGRRFVSCQEVEEGRSFAESLIKELTGSDMITGRKMRQDDWSFTPVHQLWLAANHLPHVRGTDEGIWRRLQVIPWEAHFPKAQRDTKLPEKLSREIPGIWARMAREAAAWREQGLSIPREVTAATMNYRRDQDPLRPFIEAWCDTHPKHKERRDLLWGAYLEHCEASKQQVFHERKRFYAAMEKRFKAFKSNGERGFSGVRLLSAQERMARNPRSQLMRAQQESDDNVVPLKKTK